METPRKKPKRLNNVKQQFFLAAFIVNTKFGCIFALCFSWY